MWINQELTEPVKVRYLDGNVFSQDNGGNMIGVNVFKNGQAASLSGLVSASVVRADGATVAVSGTLSGNKCSVVLPQACYAVPGTLSVVIKLSSDNTVTTVGAVVSNVYMSSTDSVVDPGTIIPDISLLIDTIEEAVASIPADYSVLDSTVGLIVDRLWFDDVASWEYGTISATGEGVYVTTRIRYVGQHTIPNNSTLVIIPDSEYLAGVAKYTEDGTFISAEDWYDYKAISCGEGGTYRFRVYVKRKDNANIPDVAAAASHISVYTVPNVNLYEYADQTNTNMLVQLLNNGYISDGTPRAQTYEIEKYSDYVEITKGRHLVQYDVDRPSGKTPWIRFSFYDSNKTFIYEQTYTPDKKRNTIEINVTDSSVAYVIVSCRTFGVAYSVHISGVFIEYINNRYTETWKSSSTVFVSREGMFSGTIENSTTGILEAKKRGYDCVRVDVQFTSDGVPVLFHDAYIGASLPVYDENNNRITNGGKVSTYTYSTLSTYHFGSTTNPILTLDECAALCKKSGLALVLELKDATEPTESNISTAYDIIAKNGMAPVTEWDVYSTVTAGYVSSIDDTADLGYISEDITTTTIDTAASMKTGKNKVYFCAYSSMVSSFTDQKHIYGARQGVLFKIGSAYSVGEIYNFRKFEKIEVANVSYPVVALFDYTV